MRMRRYSQQVEEESGIDLTPMLDVVFIMLIFFMLPVHLLKSRVLKSIVRKPIAPRRKIKAIF